jgi:ribosomal protein S27E
MPVNVTCPSCGAAVRFQSAASALAVCGYCRATLARDGEALKNLGRMAELLPDDSPVQLGTQGRWGGVAFAVVGRLQLRYDAGFWNEWHILFDDGKFGWMSESGGQWTVTLPHPSRPEFPPFEAIRPGARVQIAGKVFEVSNKEEAVCLSGEGELPFVVGAGYIAPVIDLRGPDTAFASIDYSSDPATCYVGEAVERAALKLSNTRDRAREALITAPTHKAEAISCPSCGVPWALHDQSVLTVACRSCGALSDIDGKVAKVRDVARQGARAAPALPLGSKGKFEAVEWEAIGFMRKSVPSEVGTWDEYLLYDGKGGFAWLVSERGHWNFVRQINKLPVQNAAGDRPSYTLGSDRYTHFADYRAEVIAVLGEFTWRVRVGEKVDVRDFIAPPNVLSCEQSDNEWTWSQGYYLSPDEVSAAFGLKRPLIRASGVNACQLNPHAGARWRALAMFLAFAIVAWGVHAWFASGSEAVFHRTQLELLPGIESLSSSEPFRIASDQRRVEVDHFAPVSNTWAGLEVELINRDSGDRFEAANEIAYYSGYDSDGSWSEGQQSGSAVFYGVPAGEYQLVVRGELAADAPQALSDQVTVRVTPPPFSNLFMCWLLLLLFPLFAFLRSHSFEVSRWSESDHPMSSSSEDDD